MAEGRVRARLAHEMVEAGAANLEELGVEGIGGDGLLGEGVEDDAGVGRLELGAEPGEVREPTRHVGRLGRERREGGLDGDAVGGVGGHALTDLDGGGDLDGDVAGGGRGGGGGGGRGRRRGWRGMRGRGRILEHDALVGGRGRGGRPRGRGLGHASRGGRRRARLTSRKGRERGGVSDHDHATAEGARISEICSRPAARRREPRRARARLVSG